MAKTKGVTLSAVSTPPKRETDTAQDVPHVKELEIVRLFQIGDFSQIYEILKECKSESVAISKDVVNDMIQAFRDAMPPDNLDEAIYRNSIEVPMFHGSNSLEYSALYSRFYPHMRTWHSICQLYEDSWVLDARFMENSIWLCYHMNDLSLLKTSLYHYLRLPSYDPRTLSYAINAFIYNYDIEAATGVFETIVSTRKQIHESVLLSTVVALAKVDAIFDKILAIYKVWKVSDNCESPNPQTIALLLKLHYSHGLSQETSDMEEDVERLGFKSNFLVQMVHSQAVIKSKDSNRKKLFSADDLQAVMSIRNSIMDSKFALSAFYDSFVKFSSVNLSLKMVQLMLHEMKKDRVPISRFMQNVVIQHYVSNNKFLPLLLFMLKFVSQSNPIELTYIKRLYDAFVRAYPHVANDFDIAFKNWVRRLQLSASDKVKVLDACQVVELRSGVSPFAVKQSIFSNEKKYNPAIWSELKYGAHWMVQQRALHARMNEGIPDLLKRGIRPDFAVLENTLRNAEASQRTSILNYLPLFRMQKHATRLVLLDFIMSKPSKLQLDTYITENIGDFNTSDKLLIARQCFNATLYDRTLDLLNELNKEELSDSRQMIRLNLVLRSCIASNYYDRCLKEISQFSINEMKLTPHIWKQCRFIERGLERKISHAEAKAPLVSSDLLQKMNTTLDCLRGLIGDVEARIQSDKLDLNGKFVEMFNMLDEWISKHRHTDERKF